jgi:hypothetical protein
MRLGFFFLLFCFCVSHGVNGSNNTFIDKKDLRGEWKFFDGKRYASVRDNGDQPNTIYIQVDPIATPQHYLLIQSEQQLNIFIDGQLVSSRAKNLIISLDSLSKRLSGKPFQVAIHSQEPLNFKKLRTTLSIKGSVQHKSDIEQSIELRAPTSFRDFVIIVLVILFVYWIISIRVSPRLFADYFSVSKLFFGRETEDYQYFRITSATILFYGFSCLALSLIFFITDHFYDIPVISGINEASSFFYLIGQWLLLSVVLFCVLLIKIIILFVLANIFDIREIAGFQFFNFMRLLLMVLVLLTIVISSYYLLHGLAPSVYQVFYKILGWVMLFWTVMIFFKLVSRVSFSPIHLFLYICATEIIPFLVTVKILYK